MKTGYKIRGSGELQIAKFYGELPPGWCSTEEEVRAEYNNAKRQAKERFGQIKRTLHENDVSIGYVTDWDDREKAHLETTISGFLFTEEI